MTELPPDPPPGLAQPGRASHPKRRLLIGAIAALTGSAAAITAVIILVPTNNKRLVSGPLDNATPLTTQATTAVTSSPSASPSPTPPTSPPPTTPKATDSPTSTPSQTGSPATPTDTEASANAQIIAGFGHFHDVLFHYLSTGDPDMTMLSEVATGASYQTALGSIEQTRAKNELVKGASVLVSVKVTSRPSPTTAIVCATEDDSSMEVVDADTGVVKASGFHSTTSGMKMISAGDTWKAEEPVSC